MLDKRLFPLGGVPPGGANFSGPPLEGFPQRSRCGQQRGLFHQPFLRNANSWDRQSPCKPAKGSQNRWKKLLGVSPKKAPQGEFKMGAWTTRGM